MTHLWTGARTLLLAVVVLTAPYIALAVNLTVGGRHLDTPVADLAAAALLGALVLGGVWPILGPALTAMLEDGVPPPGGRGASTATPEPRSPADVLAALRPLLRLPPPGLIGYAVLLVGSAVALVVVPDPGASAWYLVRKPLFFYVAYGVAVVWAVSRTPLPTLRWILRLALLGAAGVSLFSSVGRIAAGNALWFAAVEGLTNNHKTLAVAIAPLVPLLLSMRRGRIDLVVSGLALLAVAASMSRTAWISAAVGLSFLVAWRGYRLAARRGLVVGVVVIGVLVALYGPLLVRSHAQLDAARSRHSLDKRAWEMFQEHPTLGMGGGSNVRYEMVTFPHYRVNGVDAHGAIQKVASEHGSLGLAGWFVFVGAMGWRLYRRSVVTAPVIGALPSPHLETGLWATFLALHANLLLSTETFSQTHWMGLALVWGIAHRSRET